MNDEILSSGVRTPCKKVFRATWFY